MHCTRLLTSRLLWTAYVSLILLLNSPATTAQPVDEMSSYQTTGITFALIYNGTGLSPLESKIEVYLTSRGAETFDKYSPSASVATLSSYDIVLQAAPHLSQAKLDELEDLNKSVILIYQGIENINRSRWNDSVITNVTDLSNKTYKIAADAGPTRGYPENSSFTILNASVVRLEGSGNYTKNLISTYDSRIVVASKQQGTGKTVLIGFNLSSHHELRILDKAIYWIKGKNPTVHQNSRYCLYNCASPDVCRPCGDVVVVIDNPTNITPQENASYYNIYTAHGDIVNKLEYSEFTIANLSAVKLVVIPEEDKITSKIPYLRSINKSLMFVHRGVFEAGNTYFGGTPTGLINKTNITNGDAQIVSAKNGEPTYGYPEGAHLYTQNESQRVLAEVPGYTTLVTTANGSLISYLNGSSKVVFYGFDPDASQKTECNVGYHGSLLYLRAVQWSIGIFNVTADPLQNITFIAYNNNVNRRCSGSLTDEENAAATHLIARYGPENVTILDLSLVNAANYTSTRVIISPSSERVASLLDGWVTANKSIMLLHEGAVDVNASPFGGTSVSDNLSNAAVIQENGNGSIGYGYPTNALIAVQNYSNTSYRYLTSVPGFTRIASYGANDVLSSRSAGNRVVVYGFNPYLADFDTSFCLGYHGWKLFDRSVDWLLYSLNITSTKAKRIAIQYYGANESWSCGTEQEQRAYTRLDAKNYSTGNISKVDLSVANITDYTDTELVIIGDSYRVSSLIPVWETDKKDMLFLLHGTADAAAQFGGTVSVDPTNNSYVNITRSVVGEITMGYVGDVYVKAKAYINTDMSIQRFVHNLSSFTVLATNERGASVLSFRKRLGYNLVVYTMNLTDPTNPCIGYHGWKLFDRSVEWLLGELSVPSRSVGRIGLVVNALYNDTTQCIIPEENKTLERVRALSNISLGNINVSLVDVSEISVADFSGTEAVIVTDANVDAIGSYYESLLEGATYYGFSPTAVLMFQTGMDRYRRLYNKTSCNYTMHTGPLHGRITTTNDQNRLKELPPYGYPYNTRVQILGGTSTACYWSTLPEGEFFGFLKNDTETVTEWIGVASSVKYSEKFVLLGYRPYDAWVSGFNESNNEYYHGSKIFDRSLLWLLGDEVRKNNTKDIVLIVNNKNSILSQESFVLNWSRIQFTDDRFSFLDISDVMYYDTCGASRFIAVTGDLVSGIVDHWDNQSRGIVFIGESLYDAAKGLGAFTEGKVDPLEDEYPFPIYGQVVNNSYTTIIASPINSHWELTNESTGVYSIQKIVYLNSNYTALVLHSNRTAGDDEILLALKNTSAAHGIVMFGINSALAKDTGKTWALSSIEWSHEKDTTRPNVTNVVIAPSTYAPGNRIIFDVDAVDNRNWSVYSVMVNYSKNNVNWTTAALSRIVDPDSYTCSPKSGMNHWNGSIGPFNETFIVYTIIAVDTTGNRNETNLRYYGVPDTTPPSIHNIWLSPYMPNASDNVTIGWNTEEYSNASLSYRVNGSGGPWTQLLDSEFRLSNHSVDTGNHTANTTYQYWIQVCDLSGNCGNATNGGEYYWFCIEPGCERDPPNITAYYPANGTIFPANTTEITVFLNTSEWAECRYSNTTDTTFDLMAYTYNQTYNRTHMAYLAIKTEKYYYIRCKDMLGNKNNASLVLYYWVDSQPPTITLNSPTDASTHSGSLVTFRYTPQDNGIIGRCSLYTNFENWDSPAATSLNVSKGVQNNLTYRLCDGTFVWNVQCWDSVNNSAFASANFTLTINSTQPMLVIANGEGAANGQLDWPEGIDVFGDLIYIADKENNRYEKFNKYTGAYAGKVGGPESAEAGGIFTLPEAVSASYVTTTNGSHYFNVTQVYVADTQNMRVQVFYDGNNSYTSNITGFDDPRGVSARRGKLYVADTDNDRVMVYNSTNLTFDFNFSAGLNRPQGITADASGIYVANTGNHNVLVYTLYGNLLNTLGTQGSGAGQFQSPEDVAVDTSGNIYVSDTLNHRIQVFNTTRSLVKTLGSYGINYSQFNTPAGVAVDEEDKLYVSDTRNSRIQIFSLCFITTTTTTTSTTSTSSTSTTSVFTTTSTSTTTTTTTLPRTEVVLNEIMPHPNPAEPDDWDWVELYNRGNVDVNMTGWVLDDSEGGSLNYTIPSGIITANGSTRFMLINSSVSGINFDSTGDVVRLVNNTGILADNFTWTEDPGVSVSWMRSPDGWGPWIKSDSDHPPSPGETNTVTFAQTYVLGWNLISIPLSL